MSRIAYAAALAAAMLVAAIAPALARADGDPASDILLVSKVFLPQEANIPQAQQNQLGALTTQADRLGIPIRVAVIPIALDLGSVQPLWRKPQRYASFLGAELAFQYTGRLLVVMPNGLGVYHNGRPVNVERSALRGIKVSRATLGSAAIEGTMQLARVAGRRLTLPSGNAVAGHPARSGGGGSSSVLWIAIGAGAAAVAILAALTARFRARRPSEDAADQGTGRARR